MGLDILGFTAGLGDAARATNERRRKEAIDKRDRFDQALTRVMESEDWPEQARDAAARIRVRLFSDEKLKDKDYAALWDEVRQASGRPGQPTAEVAAARSNLPALQSLQDTLGGADHVPAAPNDDLTMRRAGSPTLDLLRPAPDPIMGAQGASAFTLQAPEQQNNLLAPRPLAGLVDQRLAENQNVVDSAPATPTVYGPKTRGERNVEAMDLFRQQQGMQLDTYRQQRQIDAEMRPDKYIVGAGGHIVLNQATGEWEATGLQRPENQTEMEAAISDYLSARGLPNDAAHRDRARDEIRRRNAAAGRDPNVVGLRQDLMDLRISERLDKYDRDQREYQALNSHKIRSVYEDDIKDAKVALPFAASIRRSAARATRGADFYMLYNMVRIADPNSVVREGELELLKSMLSVWANAAQATNKLTGADKALADEARRAALDLADLAEQRSVALLHGARRRADALSERYGTDPGLIGTIEYDATTGQLSPIEYGPFAMPQPGRPGTRNTTSPATPAGPPGAATAPPPTGNAFTDALMKALGGK